jgi:hypothetical protein
LYKWEFPAGPTDSGSWSEIGSSFFDEEDATHSSTFFQHHLAARVRVREKENNTFWAFVSKDRVIVVTKTNATGDAGDTRYHYVYGGRFNTYSSNNVTTITAAASSGTASLTVADPTIFKINEYYQLIDVTGASAAFTDVAGNSYNFGPSENVRVSGINYTTKVVTLDGSLNHDYAIGAKIGQDPQPVGLRYEKIDKFYTVNNLNTINNHLSRDPAWQWYNLRETHQSDPNHGDKSFSKRDAHNLSNSTVENDRTKETDVWPCVIYLGDDDGLYETPENVQLETRGEMIGIYYCGDQLRDESTITINGQTYIVFEIYESDLAKIAVGPVE